MRVKVHDKMEKSYVYWRTKPMGCDFRPGFKPDLTPKQMLALGVFGGKYMTDCRREFPASWFRKAKLSPDRYRASLNYFGVNASQPLAAGDLAEERLDLSGRSARMVPMVLSLLFGTTLSR